MNIFVVSCSPIESAKLLPDKHVSKMPLECCQMTAVIYSNWYLNWGTIPKKDGSPYATRRGAFRNHPCTQWAAESEENLAWMLTHGLALCEEFEYRYSNIHACRKTLTHAKNIFEDTTGKNLEIWREVKSFVRAMPEELKYDNKIDTIEAYRKYVKSKGWTIDNYVRMPERKPEWMF